MEKSFFNSASFIVAVVLLFSSCKQGDEPRPEEQEIITTAILRLQLPATGFDAFYTYKVENGFSSTAPGMVRADTIRLAPSDTFHVSVTILNERATPAEDVTTEILEEKNAHLFLFNAAPASGAGSLAFSEGSRDAAGKPFNQAGTITTGTAGSGVLRLYLMHEPTDKNAATPAASGGETDVEAVFPVRIQ